MEEFKKDDGAAAVAPSQIAIDGMKKKRHRDMIFAYSVLIWPVIHFLIFWVAMNISTIFLSFRYGNLTVGGWNHGANYMGAFKAILGIDANEGMIMNWRALLNNLSLIPLSMLINLPITLIFSFAIFRKIKGYKIYQVTLFLPAMISATVLCFVFKMVINGNDAILNRILTAQGLEHIIPTDGWLGDEHTAWPSILVFSVWTGISTNIIYFVSSMARTPDGVIESAQLDGASEMKIFVKIVLPMMWPTICTISIGIVSGCFTWYMPSLLIDPANEYITTMGLIIISNTKGGQYGLASVWGIIVAVIGTVFIAVFRKIVERGEEALEY